MVTQLETKLEPAIDDGGPAFPQPKIVNGVGIAQGGLSIRDVFAVMMVHATFLSFDARQANTSREDLKADADAFYRMADAMIEARKKKP